MSSSSDDSSDDSVMFTPEGNENGEPKSKRQKVDWLSPRRDPNSPSKSDARMGTHGGMPRNSPKVKARSKSPRLSARQLSRQSSFDIFTQEELREQKRQCYYRRLLPEFGRKHIRGGFLGYSELTCVDRPKGLKNGGGGITGSGIGGVNGSGVNGSNSKNQTSPNKLSPTSPSNGRGVNLSSLNLSSIGDNLGDQDRPPPIIKLSTHGRNGEHPLAFSRKIGNWKKYERLKVVGQGAYGKVYEARNTETGEIVAAKVTTKLDDEDGACNLSFMREVQVLRRVRGCKSIVQLLEMAVTSKNEPVIVMEYCHASLENLLQSEKHVLFTGNIKYLLQQVLDGTQYMHDMGILHRDLATKNILFNISGEVKVCDFGISRMAFGDHTSNHVDSPSRRDREPKLARATNLEPPGLCVTLPYRSIELLLGERNYGPALDVWGVGCILGEILIQKGGVSKMPMFRPETGVTAENANKPAGWQVVATHILSIVGRPSAETWPKFEHLLKNFSGFEGFEAQIRTFPRHKEKNDEAKFISDYFRNGKGSALTRNRQLDIRPSVFTLMGKLLALNPDNRISARAALKDPWFEEKPLPTWDHELFRILGTGVAEAAVKAKEDEKAKRQYLRELQSMAAASGGGTGVPVVDARARLEERLEEKMDQEKRDQERKDREERRRGDRDGGHRDSGEGRDRDRRHGGGDRSGDRAGSKSQSHSTSAVPRGRGLPDLNTRKKPSAFSSGPPGTSHGSQGTSGGRGGDGRRGSRSNADVRPGSGEKPKFDSSTDSYGRPLPSGWVRAWSKSQAKFFYAQPSTGKNAWKTPRQ